MTLFAGELLEVAPKDPASVAVVGGYIVVPDANLVFGGGAGLMPNGSFAVLGGLGRGSLFCPASAA